MGRESPEARQTRSSKQRFVRVGSSAFRLLKPSKESRTKAQSLEFHSSFERIRVTSVSQRSMQSLRPGTQRPVNLQATVEVYSCGCKIHYRAVDDGEFEGDLPQTIVLVPECVYCRRHAALGQLHMNPPPDARLVTVLHENENYLNE